MSLIELCSCCSNPATTILRYHDKVEMYCDKHWEERNQKIIKPVVCEDYGL
jgi:hypothetical protein